MDLKELERRFDELFTKETPETFEKWLLNSRKNEYTMNPIIKVFEKISDEDLKKCCREILEWHQTAILKIDGICRKYAQEIKSFVSKEADTIRIMEVSVMEEVMKRFSK